MAISLDELNGSFTRLRGPAINGFERAVPLWKAALEKDRMPDEGGTYLERQHIGGSPAQGRGLPQGDEVLPMVTTNVSSQLRVEPYTISAAINIPRQLLKRQSGPRAIIKVIETYPKAFLAATARDIHKYLLTGVSAGLAFSTAELSGFLTLNGQFAAGLASVVGVTNGLLDFQTPAAQGAAAQVVQNVAKSDALSYYNQYGDITLWAADGWSVLTQAYAEAAEFAANPEEGPDLGYMDMGTFRNFRQEQKDIVRLKAVNDSDGKTNYLALPLGMAVVTGTSDLDLALFAGVANDGVTYLINSDFMEFGWVERPNVSDFKEMLGNQRVVTAHFDAQFNCICEKLTAQACVSGGAA